MNPIEMLSHCNVQWMSSTQMVITVRTNLHQIFFTVRKTNITVATTSIQVKVYDKSGQDFILIPYGHMTHSHNQEKSFWKEEKYIDLRIKITTFWSMT